jgi:hypothetical protein
MTWSERVGDLATNIILVLVNAIRILTLAMRILARILDGLVTSLGERSEQGLSRTGVASGAEWLQLPARVAWGIAAVALRVISIATVFLRQATEAIDEFFRVLAEGEGAPTGGGI